MTPDSLTTALKEEARRLGFDLVGVAPAVAPPSFARFEEWLAEGCAAGMHYLAQRAETRSHPRHVLEGVRSILMLGMNYRTVEPAGAPAASLGEPRASARGLATSRVDAIPGLTPRARQKHGVVSRYAWGDDYHDVLRGRLHTLADFHRQLAPEAQVRGVVDSAPLMEREFGRLAGLGWIGKNTLLINRQFGSWFFLAALLTTAELACDQPCETDHCGSCRACLDACPTGALAEPYRCDARRCISYLTIEHRGPIPPEFHVAIGNRLFGCDACQEACPWNRATPHTPDPAFHPRPGMNPVDLAELRQLDEAAFRERFAGTPLLRAKREGLLRDAEVATGNTL
jgi:epoxyqueuosine reductase